MKQNPFVVTALLILGVLFAAAGCAHDREPDTVKTGGVMQAQPKTVPDRKSTRLNSSHSAKSRMPSSA